MSQNYTPTEWIDNRTVGTASVMNNMEKGIEDAHDRIDGFDLQIREKVDKVKTLEQLGLDPLDSDNLNFLKICNAINKEYKLFVDSNYIVKVDSPFDLNNDLYIESNNNELYFQGTSDIIFNVVNGSNNIKINKVNIKTDNKIIFYNDSIDFEIDNIEFTNNIFEGNTILIRLEEETGSFNSKINKFKFFNNKILNLSINGLNDFKVRGFINITNVPFEIVELLNNEIHNSKVLPFYFSVDDDNTYRDEQGLPISNLLEKRKYLQCNNNVFINDEGFYNDRDYSEKNNMYYGLGLIECGVLDFKNNIVKNVIAKNNLNSTVSTSFLYNGCLNTNVYQNEIYNVFTFGSTENYIIKAKSNNNLNFCDNKFDYSLVENNIYLIDNDSNFVKDKWKIDSNIIIANKLGFEDEQITCEYLGFENNIIEVNEVFGGINIGTAPIYNNETKRKYSVSKNRIKALNNNETPFNVLCFGYKQITNDSIKGTYLKFNDNFIDVPNLFNNEDDCWYAPRFEFLEFKRNILTRRPKMRYTTSGLLLSENIYLNNEGELGSLGCTSFCGDSEICESFNVFTNNVSIRVGDLVGIVKNDDYMKDTHAQLITFDVEIKTLDGTIYSNSLRFIHDIKNNLIYDYSKNIKTDITNFLTTAYDSTFSLDGNPISFETYKKTYSYCKVIIKTKQLNKYVVNIKLNYNVKHIPHDSIVDIS